MNAIDRLARWIKAAPSIRSAAQRYRSAVGRSFVETDGDYASLADAHDSRVAELREMPKPEPRRATLCDDVGTPFTELAEQIPPGEILITGGRVIESADEDTTDEDESATDYAERMGYM